MDSKSLEKHRKLMLEFIDMYRSLPCLWERRHRSYGVRAARQAAYQRLLRAYRAIDPQATLHTVKGRLDIIRSGFIRELKKVRLSKEMSSDPSTHYIPRLWYYDSCTFLEDQYLPSKEARTAIKSESNYDNDDEETVYSNAFDDMETEYLEECSNSSIDGEPSTKRKKNDDPVTVESIDDGPSRYSDEDLDCIGKAIALQMRDLEPYQSAIAHKLISEAIFYAKMGKLTPDSHVTLNLRDDNIDYC